MSVVDIQKIWSDVMRLIDEKVTHPNAGIWLSQAFPLHIKDDCLVIAVPNRFVGEWVQGRLGSTISQALNAAAPYPLELEFVVHEAAIENQNDPQGVPAVEADNFPHPPLTMHHEVDGAGQPLNPKYTFDTFVTGAGNRLSHAAALAVAEAPARAYNPLFLYGGVGLGKTHLMQAIAHHVLKRNVGRKVVYVSSERFTNEMINSIRDGDTSDFRARFRSVDVLLVDDIQFLAGKESTQEEFFHTFNTLHEANKQIVISSDRPPKEIPTLEERLRSRFEWGLISDIQPPDLETRIAILRKKAQLENLSVPDDVTRYIAEHITSNIRELEGALIRLVAISTLENQKIDLDLAINTLQNIILPAHRQPTTLVGIMETVAQHYGLEIEDLRIRKRTRALVLPRQIAMFLCRELTDASLPRIGEEFGGRDHTTVMHACDKIKRECKSDPDLANEIATLRQTIQRHV